MAQVNLPNLSPLLLNLQLLRRVSRNGAAADGVEVRLAHHVHHAVGDHRRAVDGRAEVGLEDGFLLLGIEILLRGENHEVAVLVADIDFAVGEEGRAPHVSQFSLPVSASRQWTKPE